MQKVVLFPHFGEDAGEVWCKVSTFIPMGVPAAHAVFSRKRESGTLVISWIPARARYAGLAGMTSGKRQ